MGRHPAVLTGAPLTVRPRAADRRRRRACGSASLTTGCIGGGTPTVRRSCPRCRIQPRLGRGPRCRHVGSCTIHRGVARCRHSPRRSAHPWGRWRTGLSPLPATHQTEEVGGSSAHADSGPTRVAPLVDRTAPATTLRSPKGGRRELLRIDTCRPATYRKSASCVDTTLVRHRAGSTRPSCAKTGSSGRSSRPDTSVARHQARARAGDLDEAPIRALARRDDLGGAGPSSYVQLGFITSFPEVSLVRARSCGGAVGRSGRIARFYLGHSLRK
jgi:hypothetical protein